MRESRYIFFEAPLKVDFKNFAKYLAGLSDQTKMVAFDRERTGRCALSLVPALRPQHDCSRLVTGLQCKVLMTYSLRPCRWMLVPRGREGDVVYVDTPPQFIWHYANASEDPVTGAKHAHDVLRIFRVWCLSSDAYHHP